MAIKLNVTQNEFKDSFKKHYQAYNCLKKSRNSANTRKLLLFYSVECGLKYWIMKNKMLKDYIELEGYAKTIDKDISGHNVKEMLKERELDREFILKSIKTAQNGTVLPKKFNELWRYGMQVDDREAEEYNEKVLNNIVEWLHQRI